MNNRSHLAVAATLGFVLAAAIIPAARALATTGPAFNIFPVSYTGEENHDYPLLDGRNYTDSGSFSSSQSDHDNGVTADPGDILEFVVYYHNGAVDAPENIAKNVRIKVTLPTGLSQTHTVSATITADNAVTVTSAAKGGDMIAHINDSEQSLEYISGSTRWYADHGSSYQTLPDGIISSGVNLGEIRGCWDYSGFVKFQVRVTDEQDNGYLNIEKTVSNHSQGTSFGSTADAEPSDIVEFRIKVEAREGDVEEVIVRDILPNGLEFEDDTLRIDGVSKNGTQGLFGSGYEAGTLSENDTLNLSFQAKVASASFFDGNSRTLTNTANARGRDVSTVQDTARVVVEGQVLGSSFRLSKDAFNQTQGVNARSVLANSGDIINYTLTYTNTGDITIHNVVVEDDLSDVLRSADVINMGGGQLSGNTIRYPEISVPAGVSIDKTFQVRVRQIAVGETDLVMTNFYGNQVDVQLRPPTVKGTYIAPKSGVEDWIAPLLALIFTVALFARKKYQNSKLAA